MKNFRLNTSKDLVIHRYKNGVKLARPHQRADKFSIDTGQTVGTILKLPFNVYFYNTDAIFLHSSEPNAEILGFESTHDCVGKSMLATCVPNNATQKIILNNQDVLKNQCIRIFEEDINRIDNINYQGLTVKSPWYDEEGNVKGVFGCSIALGIHPLANALEKIAALGLLPSPQTIPVIKHNLLGKEIAGTYFSQREIEVIQLTAKGQTARAIAEKLILSKRTVEHYLNNIKIKLNVNTKPELLDKVFQHLNYQSLLD